MKLLIAVACLGLCSAALAQNYYEEYQTAGQPQQHQHRPAPARLSPGNGPVEAKPTPVPILKQINRHNDDGSYTYGFEGADGSFKIETKSQTGEVKGKYGYVDETGKVRVVEYGADKFGFQPSGEGITVAPPTLVDETRLKEEAEYEEEQQRLQRPYIARGGSLTPRPPQRAQPQYEEYQQPQYELRPQPQQQQQPRRQQFIQSPVPQRAVVSGAAPSDVTYSPSQRPPRPDQEYVQPRANYAPSSQQQQQQYEQHQLSRGYEVEQPAEPAQHQQALQYAPPARPVAPQQTHTIARPKAVAPQPRGLGVLDQLAKDYALPANGAAPLTDISFGYY